jgi:hypothetical protein
MFADIERMDARAWAEYLAPDAVMRFGNDDPIYGRDGCRAALESFYARIEVVTIYRTDANDLISDYRVYTDIAPVFAGPPAAAAPAT